MPKSKEAFFLTEDFFQEANALSIDGDEGKKSFMKMRAMLELLNRKFHQNYYLATKLKFQMAMVGLEELQGEDEIDEKIRVCGEILGAHVSPVWFKWILPQK